MRAMFAVGAMFIAAIAGSLARADRPPLRTVHTVVTMTVPKFRPLRVRIDGHWFIAYSPVTIEDQAEPRKFETVEIDALPVMPYWENR